MERLHNLHEEVQHGEGNNRFLCGFNRFFLGHVLFLEHVEDLVGDILMPFRSGVRIRSFVVGDLIDIDVQVTVLFRVRLLNSWMASLLG